MKIELTIPTSLNEITLEQYQKFLYIVKNNEDNDFIQLKTIEIFCNVPLNLVSQMSLKDVNEINEILTKMLSEMPKHKLTFTLGNTEFGFITNLDEITLGEFRDLDSYITDWDTMHKAMAVLYRPITKKVKEKYQIEPYNGTHTYADVMKHMPLDVALGGSVFFYNLGKDLLKASLNYLEKNKEVLTTHEQDNLLKSGDGIQVSINLLREMLQDLNKYQILEFPLL